MALARRRSPARHGFSENALPLEEKGFSLSDQDICPVTRLLSLLDQALCRLSHFTHPESYFLGQHRAEVCANLLGQVLATTRTHGRASAEQVGAKFGEAVFLVARQAVGDEFGQ
jgi:hypothetical protein